ncbi:MAG: PIN domain-containing protein [Ilumatobacteraceae bacterium]
MPPVQASAAISYASPTIALPPDETSDALDRFVIARARGGSTYDALIGATAAHHGASLLTRDERAVETYERLGVDVMWVAT